MKNYQIRPPAAQLMKLQIPALLERRHIIACIGLLSLSLFLLIQTGCNRQEPTAAKTPAAANAQTLKIGLVPEQDIFAQEKRYQPLLAEIAKELGITIEIKVLPSYREVVTSFRELHLDGAFFGSLTGAVAIKELGIEPLVRPRYVDGSSTCYGMVFVRKGSGFHTAEDLRDKRLVLVDEASAAGYLLPLSYFNSLGIENYKSWFKETYFSGNHEDAIREVLSGFADIGAAQSTVLFGLARKDPRILRDLEIVATSPLFPTNALAVRPDLDNDLKLKLKHQLLTLNLRESGRTILAGMQITEFIETEVQDYQTVLDYAAHMGMNSTGFEPLDDRKYSGL